MKAHCVYSAILVTTRSVYLSFKFFFGLIVQEYISVPHIFEFSEITTIIHFCFHNVVVRTGNQNDFRLLEFVKTSFGSNISSVLENVL